MLRILNTKCFIDYECLLFELDFKFDRIPQLAAKGREEKSSSHVAVDLKWKISIFLFNSLRA